MNIKRVHRLWKQEGLRVPAKARKKRRLGGPANGAGRLRAGRINHVWSCDFVWDQTESGRRLKWLPVLDEHTRECLALEVEHSITAREVIEVLERLVEERGAEFIRSDNGPEFIAEAVKAWIAQKGMKTLYIEPGSPRACQKVCVWVTEMKGKKNDRDEEEKCGRDDRRDVGKIRNEPGSGSRGSTRRSSGCMRAG